MSTINCRDGAAVIGGAAATMAQAVWRGGPAFERLDSWCLLLVPGSWVDRARAPLIPIGSGLSTPRR